MRAGTPEYALIRRTRRMMWLQTAVVFAVAMAAAGALVYGLVLTRQGEDATRTLQVAINSDGGPTDLPPGVWLYRLEHDELKVGGGGPGQPPDAKGFAAVAAGGPARTCEVHMYGREYLVRTVSRGGVTIQAALDLSHERGERRRLYAALAAAGALGLGLSIAVGAFTARRAIAPLGQAMARQQRFIADASHELRTPLTQLHTRAQLLAREATTRRDPERLAEDAEQLVRGTRQMGELVEELLLAAQLRHRPQESGPVDMRELADEVAAADSVRARERGIELSVAGEPDRYLVRGVRSALRRVLTSLVDNALGHTPSGGHVTISVGREGREVVCAVRDDGVGLDEDDVQRLFERFARGRHGDGRRFGLGLALVREVVQAHRGTVSATGAPGAGATFTVRLPPLSLDDRRP